MSKRVGSFQAIFLLGVVVVALSAGAESAGAQGVTAALYPPTQTVAPGSEFDLELRITAAGSAFNGFDATVSYDTTALVFMPLAPTSLQQGTLMTDACGNTFHRFLKGAGVDTITDVLLCAGVSVTGPGQIYKLHFKASNTVQVTHVVFVPGTLKFYAGGLFVNPVTSTDAAIGIGMAVSGVGDDAEAGGLALAAVPNPSRGNVAFTSSWRSSGPESLTVRDVQGRTVRSLKLLGRQASWDGRRDSGEAVPNGIYFATLKSGGRATTIRFSLIR